MTKGSWKSDFERLWLPLVLLICAVTAAAIVLAITHRSLEAAQQRQQRQHNALRAEQQRVRTADDEKKTIERYRDEYSALQRQGFIGEEQRINWVDSLRHANFALNLFGIDYSVGAQVPYTASAVSSGALQLRESQMRVGLKLLHEEDLLRFFEYLMAQHVGVFHPRTCTLVRLDAGPKPSIGPNVEATCEIAWITAQPPQLGNANAPR